MSDTPKRGRPPAAVKTSVLTVRLPVDKHDQIIRLSRANGVTVSSFVASVLESRAPVHKIDRGLPWQMARISVHNK